MEKINGIIVNGRVYEIRDRKGWNCSPCSCDHQTVIKCFNDPDQDFNRLCAEELVEKLNEE